MWRKYPLSCAAGLVPDGRGDEAALRKKAGLADYAFRGSLTKDMVKVMQTMARKATQHAKKGAGAAAAKQEAIDDGSNGLRAAVMDAAINTQTVVGEVIKSKAPHLLPRQFSQHLV